MLIRYSSSTEPRQIERTWTWTFEPPATLPPFELPTTPKPLPAEEIAIIIVAALLGGVLLGCLLIKCCPPSRNKAKRQHRVQLEDGINANQIIHVAVTSTAATTSYQDPSSSPLSSKTSGHRVTNPSSLPHTNACVNLTPSAPPEISYSPNFCLPGQ
ncbi:uncharacterized protein [Periplaneta americana]|uniref:uncharacterized protein isoform X2 n=1 Tax=Periplaneta americana TaxID=6978 RepID=UPI0037E9309E